MATILIVDDSHSVRKQLKESLEKAGHSVIEAVDGNDGLDKILNTSGIELVITDYNMPGHDGVAMLTKAKEQLGDWKYPIFMLTTETSENQKAAGKKVGITAWIIKPYVEPKLLMAVEKVLLARQAAQS